MNNHPAEVLEKFKNVDVGEVGISSISVSELHYGAFKSKKITQNIKRLEEFLYPFSILSYDEIASKEYGKIRSQLEKKGKVIGPLDMLIATHAISKNLTLITNNTKEFDRIERLKAENWVKK